MTPLHQVVGLTSTEIEIIFIFLNVTAIHLASKQNNSEIINLLLEDSRIEIGIRCFESYTSLTEMVIPPTVSSIGNQAFSKCTSLVKISIPESVKIIGHYAF